MCHIVDKQADPSARIAYIGYREDSEAQCARMNREWREKVQGV
jgi:hypothetical protein